MEQTLVVLKPDAVQRMLAGEIIKRFEQVGLKIVAMRLLRADKALAEKHYPADREAFIRGMGEKTLENYRKLGIDPAEKLGTDDSLKIGQMIREWLVDYITAGPVLAMVLEGPHSVELVRKLCGHTLPLAAAPGTIRGDYSYDSSYLANTAGRPIKNMIHASGTVEEAKYEIPLWFKKNEIVEYRRVDEEIMK